MQSLSLLAKKVALAYSEVGIEKCEDIATNETVLNLGNKCFAIPPVWKSTHKESKKDLKEGKELAFVTAWKYANFIAGFTPYPGAISVAQDENGNTMFALSVRKDRRDEFDRIMNPEQQHILNSIPDWKQRKGAWILLGASYHTQHSRFPGVAIQNNENA